MMSQNKGRTQDVKGEGGVRAMEVVEGDSNLGGRGSSGDPPRVTNKLKRYGKLWA